MPPGKLHGPQNVSLHGRSRPCDTPSPNPHTSQPDPRMASCHIINLSLSTLQNDWLQQFAHVWAIGVFWASSKTDFLVQSMRQEAMLSNRHRSRTLLSKATHLAPTRSNAARRCAQRARQFVWQCRSQSEADDPLGGSIFAP